MPRIEKELTVLNEQGLHARPAAFFVQIAAKFDATVTVSKDGEKVNGKSIMGILMLGAEKNSKLFVCVDGSDAEQLMGELEAFLSRNE
ncbi:MAG TPA: HPr family phosphocarrier protein [Candidatus Omnitrophota bacterium]|jgi:phosphocarrier protein|nr:HPr family phosphocarrier protein [Candidatus Omnitrophota bacterium]HPN55949.1 HPr family phosphocarrier protein [Candidatus Omnitrophota bacterium]